MYDAYMGTIYMFAGNFAPMSTVYCNGALLPIDQFNALFALIGTTYGGDGQTTFAVPNLQGRTPIGAGGNIPVGMVSGSETMTITTQQLPSHNHPQIAVVHTSSNTPDGSKNPALALAVADTIYTQPTNAGANVWGTNADIGVTGSGSPFSIMQPYNTINYVIATEGIFPSRN